MSALLHHEVAMQHDTTHPRANVSQLAVNLTVHTHACDMRTAAMNTNTHTHRCTYKRYAYIEANYAHDVA